MHSSEPNECFIERNHPFYSLIIADMVAGKCSWKDDLVIVHSS
jgi:hypothetical protein